MITLKTYTNNSMQAFTDIQALIIDMDGVLWHGMQPLPGLNTFFQTLRDTKLPFILATNNASLTRDQYIDKLAGMNITVSADEILSSGIATALYLAKQVDPAQTRVYVIGEDGATQPLIEQGFTLTDLYETDADFVVCGKDEALSWDKLATATLNIRAGAKFIGTNADSTLPTERGITHGNGAILAALQAGSGIEPTIIGKPEPILYQQALASLGVDASKTVAIGDRLDTDILGAIRADIRSIMVLTGVSGEADVAAVDYQPTWIMPDLDAITKALLKS